MGFFKWNNKYKSCLGLQVYSLYSRLNIISQHQQHLNKIKSNKILKRYFFLFQVFD